MRCAALLLSLFVTASAWGQTMEPGGFFIRECSLPGETRRDWVVPRQANALQVSRQRWLIVYGTHGYRGVDDERSVVYQLRDGGPEGRVLREGFLARALDDWRPDGVPAPPAGTAYFKQLGHVVAFGVPRGAKVGGEVPPHANRFVACWRVLGRPLDVGKGYLGRSMAGSALDRETRYVEWIQCRLNDREDDIEVTQPARRLRQQGFEEGERFCSHADAGWMNQAFVPHVPLGDDHREWAVCNHFDRGRLALLKFRFDLKADRYAWVETGPWLSAAKAALSEASLVQSGDGTWLVSARTAGKVGWASSREPFREWTPFVFPEDPHCSAPHTSWRCADGVVRIFTGDRVASPQRYDRDPLYQWDVAGWPPQIGSRQLIFDTRAAGLPFRPAVRSKADFPMLLPHQGRTQLVVFGVNTRGYLFPYDGQPSIVPINERELDASGLYFARLTYVSAPPPRWRFE